MQRPIPATGNYATFWVSNSPENKTTYREGVLNELGSTIHANTGTYAFEFEVACLGGYGEPEMAIYAVNNPSNSYSQQPTSSHSPINTHLFGTSKTVLLGTITLDKKCDNNKTVYDLTFNSTVLNSISDMTHIMILASDEKESAKRFIGIDNFCLSPIAEDENCCDEIRKELKDIKYILSQLSIKKSKPFPIKK
jgi:hypothetical protein